MQSRTAFGRAGSSCCTEADTVFARTVRVSQPAVLSALLVIQLFGIVIPPPFSPKEHQKERCDHSWSQRSFITFHGALWIILLLARFPATFHMIVLEQTFFNDASDQPFSEMSSNGSALFREIARSKGNYLCTLPVPSPPMSFSTSQTPTRLKSPMTLCLRQLAATANSSADCLSSYWFKP